jgi:hypothetical protein
MEPAPFCEEMLLMLVDDPESFSGVRRTHVVILPQGGRSLVVAEANQNLSSVRGLDVDMRRLVLPRRGVYIDFEIALIVDLDHSRS